VTLNGGSIDLGANGTSVIDAYYSLELIFRDTLHLNGPFSVDHYANYFGVKGDDGDNTFIYGEHAQTDSFYAMYGMNHIDIDLGAGDDTAWFYGGLIVDTTEPVNTISVNMGSGDDSVYLNNHM